MRVCSQSGQCVKLQKSKEKASANQMPHCESSLSLSGKKAERHSNQNEWEMEPRSPADEVSTNSRQVRSHVELQTAGSQAIVEIDHLNRMAYV